MALTINGEQFGFRFVAREPQMAFLTFFGSRT
jgi:hypothetical protein